MLMCRLICLRCPLEDVFDPLLPTECLVKTETASDSSLAHMPSWLIYYNCLSPFIVPSPVYLNFACWVKVSADDILTYFSYIFIENRI